MHQYDVEVANIRKKLCDLYDYNCSAYGVGCVGALRMTIFDSHWVLMLLTITIAVTITTLV